MTTKLNGPCATSNSPVDVARRIPRGLRLMLQAGKHPDDMDTPCLRWLQRNQLITAHKSTPGWAWTGLGNRVIREVKRQHERSK